MTYLLVGLFCFSTMISCQKEKPKPVSSSITSGSTGNFVTREALKKYDDKTCTIYDSNGRGCLGLRCGSPNGSKCPKETVCQCVFRVSETQDPFVFEDYTYGQFNALWKSDDGRKMLEAKGYYEVDNKE